MNKIKPCIRYESITEWDDKLILFPVGGEAEYFMTLRFLSEHICFPYMHSNMWA